MTSELCLMNRLAVVLAADSATTVTHYTTNGEERRYFKGANKVFQLSSTQPIGMMIFDSASILNVPWEVAIKMFRRHLGDRSFPDLDGYAQEFFTFLQGNANLFPERVQDSEMEGAAILAALRTCFPLPQEGDQSQRQALFEAAIAAATNRVAELPLVDGLDDQILGQLQALHREGVAAKLMRFFPDGEPRPNNFSDLADLSVRVVLTAPGEYFGTTGLVFAGYGEHDVFPAMLEYKSFGVVGNRHLAERISGTKIDHGVPAWLSAFAQTSMSDTFSRGLSADVFTSVMGAVGAGLTKLLDDLCKAQKIEPASIPDRHRILAAARDSISDAVLDKALTDHALPLRRVLGALPVEEMAELAETLINLQSLKEKVTVPTETVGGPVDVAVITKSEGLVWIKRKHYFDPTLNSRYLHRLSAGHH